MPIDFFEIQLLVTGAGGVPFSSTAPGAAAVAGLVPAGLTPIALFPAGSIPQTLPATSVIFSEVIAAAGKRRKRNSPFMSRHPYKHYYKGEPKLDFVK